MAETNPSFLNNAKVQQIIVQYACRVPVRKELNTSEKTALKNMLKEFDSAKFQIFDEPFQKNPMCLFQVQNQVPVGPNIITLPSFIFANDSIIFFYPTKMVGKDVPAAGRVDGRDLNAKVLDWIFKVQNGISNLSCQRSGKIFDIILGPVTPSDKAQMFKKLFSRSLDKVGEVTLSFADYHTEGAEIFNIGTTIRYVQQNLHDNFFVNLRVDINNRTMASAMEPRDVDKVWKFADAIIDTHLKEIIEI